MNSKEWAKREGVHPVTAYRWFREDKLPVPAQRVGGLILAKQSAESVPAETVVVYARAAANRAGRAVTAATTEVPP